jgi:hypothetical protein
MVERETSGTPQKYCPTSKVTSAAPGGPALRNTTPPTTLAVPPRRYPLQRIIALIKQPNQPPPLRRNE